MAKSDITVDFKKRAELEKALGADHVSYCYQCGACVGDCPTARFDKDFNPRAIMLKALVGDIDDLTKENSIIWHCSNCCNCYERCPQDVRPVEVIIALKNMSAKSGTSNEEIITIAKRIRETGRSVPVMASIQRMRDDLGLPPLPDLDITDLEKILSPENKDKQK
ncbi:4Fe-4S dicluster domain-containing protein [Bacteroidota bacterium]